MSTLQETLKRLIGRDLGVSPDQITPEFVRDWRNAHVPDEPRLEFRSHYGGYRGSRLRRLTPKQMESNRKRADEFLRRFSS
jgi:hypothetical protein